MGPQPDLRPSAAKTWSVCTAQPWEVLREKAAGRIVEPKRDYTEAGTKAHKVAEDMLRSKTPDARAAVLASAEVPDDDKLAIASYVRYVLDTSGADGYTVETRVSLPWGGHGTVDAFSIHLDDGAEVVLDVMDYKHGAGVEVTSDALQLQIYAGCVLLQLANDGLIDPEAMLDRKVRTHVIQPRHFAQDVSGVTPHTSTVRDVMTTVANVSDTALLIYAERDLKFAPGEHTCQFCPLEGLCAAKRDAASKALPEDAALAVKTPGAPLTLPDPATMTDEQIAHVVTLGPLVEKWLDKVNDRAAARLLAGGTIPGLKVVEGRSTRTWTSESDAAKLLKNHLTTDEIFVKKLVTPKQAEDLLKGKELSTKFQNKLETLITKGEGKPKVVPASDKRPALTPPSAEAVFEPEPSAGAKYDADGL